MLRFCNDIGMYALDRPREVSCVHRTDFCNRTCYNNKLERAFNGIKNRDVKNEEFWQSVTPQEMKKLLNRRTKSNKRIRLCTRGEPIADHTDVTRILGWARANPDWLWWVPTRAWRHEGLRLSIENTLMFEGNIRVLASVDPETPELDMFSLGRSEWSLLYYGDNDGLNLPFNFFKCPKTFKKIKGHCRTCMKGCFSPCSTVHLKMH